MSKRRRTGANVVVAVEQQPAVNASVATSSTADKNDDFGDFLMMLAYDPSSFYGDDGDAAGTSGGSGKGDRDSNAVSSNGHGRVNIMELPVDPVIKYKLEIEANFSLKCLLQETSIDTFAKSLSLSSKNNEHTKADKVLNVQLQKSLQMWREHQVVHVFPLSYAPNNSNNSNSSSSSSNSSSNSSSSLSPAEIAFICDPSAYYSSDLLAPDIGNANETTNATTLAHKSCRLQFQYAVVSALDMLLNGTSDCFYLMGNAATSAVYFNGYFYSKGTINSSGDNMTENSFECILSGVRNAFVQRLLQCGCDLSFIEKAPESLRGTQALRGTAPLRTLRVTGREQVLVVVDCIAELALQGGRTKKLVEVPAIISNKAFKFSTAKSCVAAPIMCSYDFESEKEHSIPEGGSDKAPSGAARLHRVKVSGAIFSNQTFPLYSLLEAVAKINCTVASCNLEPLYVRPEDRCSGADIAKATSGGQSGGGIGAPPGQAKNPLLYRGTKDRSKNRLVSKTSAGPCNLTLNNGDSEPYFRITYFPCDSTKDFTYRSDSIRNDTTINSLTWRGGEREGSGGKCVFALVDKETADRVKIVNHADDEVCRRAGQSKAPSVDYSEEEVGVTLEPANKYSIYTT